MSKLCRRSYFAAPAKAMEVAAEAAAEVNGIAETLGTESTKVGSVQALQSKLFGDSGPGSTEISAKTERAAKVLGLESKSRDSVKALQSKLFGSASGATEVPRKMKTATRLKSNDTGDNVPLMHKTLSRPTIMQSGRGVHVRRPPSRRHASIAHESNSRQSAPTVVKTVTKAEAIAAEMKMQAKAQAKSRARAEMEARARLRMAAAAPSSDASQSEHVIAEMLTSTKSSAAVESQEMTELSTRSAEARPRRGVFAYLCCCAPSHSYAGTDNGHTRPAIISSVSSGNTRGKGGLTPTSVTTVSAHSGEILAGSTRKGKYTQLAVHNTNTKNASGPSVVTV